MTTPKLLLAVFVALVTHYSQAADIRAFQTNKVIIEGELVEGDYDRFVRTVDAIGFDVSEASIYSKGGSVAEAIAIGTLIRELRLHTVAPRGFGASGNVCPGVKEQSNCTCLSACVLVFVGGIHRYGNVLGVHRSYINHRVLKSMGGTEGLNASTKLMEDVGAYLGSMGVPRAIVDRMNATSSQDISYLPDEEITRYRERIESVTADDVLATARRRIDIERLAIVLVGDADAIAEELERAGIGPISVERDEGPAARGPTESLERQLGPIDADETQIAVPAEDLALEEPTREPDHGRPA